FQLLTTP
ncbi:acetyltransferase domain protein, partial [Vibrio parahaemolyticus V-223/04]